MTTSAELEAAADKHAYPWECLICRKTFHYARPWRVKIGWGDLCISCFGEEDNNKEVKE